MCLNPQKIRNNRKFLRPEIDSPYMIVPCGKCVECENDKVNDWYVRLRYEFERTKSMNGATYFLTLTYNDFCVPRLSKNDVSDILDQFEIDVDDFNDYVFNKNHLIQFFKDFRDLIREKYGVSGIKYFLVCEYGTDENSTHRPHYHVLIFSPVALHYNIIHSLANYCWSERVKYDDVPDEVINISMQDNVQDELKRRNFVTTAYFIIAPPSGKNHKKPMFKRRYGFTSWSKDFGAVVKSPSCIQYIIKYISKQKDVHKHIQYCLKYISERLPSLNELEGLFPPVNSSGNLIRDWKNYNNSDLSKNIEFIKWHKRFKELHNCFQFTLSSNFLGDSLLYEISDDFDNGKEFLKQNKVTFKDDTFIYRIPKYIIRRIFYNVVSVDSDWFHNQHKTTLKLNSIGKECLIDFFLKKQLDYLHQVRLYTSERYVSLMDKEFIYNWFNKFGISFNQCLSILRNLSDEQIKSMYLYRCTLKGVSLFYNSSKFSELSYDDLNKFGFELFICKVKTSDLQNMPDNYFKLLPVDCVVPFDDVLGTLSCIPPEYDGCIYDNLPQFKDFNKYFDWINDIKSSVRLFKVKDKNEKYRRSNLLRSLYNRFIYNIN